MSRSPVINIDEPIGRVVGRRAGPEGLSTATSRADHAKAWTHALGGARVPRGVYRFATHEEADRWLWRMLTRRTR